MFFRKVIISEECMKWLEKSSSYDVTPEEAMSEYEKRRDEIQEEVLQAIVTRSKDVASADGKVEVVVEVKLVKAVTLKIMKVVTRVYAVVYAKNKKKYYVFLDINKELKKVSKINKEFALYANDGDFVDFLDVVKNDTYRISM